VDFVSNAFIYLKAIGAAAAAKPLLDRAGVVADNGITGLDDHVIAAGIQRFWHRKFTQTVAAPPFLLRTSGKPPVPTRCRAPRNL